jgi:hypothetical protein
MKVSLPRLAATLLLVLLGTPLGADISVLIVPPTLKPGMARLQAMLDGEVEAAAAEIEELAGAYLLKPLLMSAVARANASALLPAAAAARSGFAASVSLGCFASAQADTWDVALLTERLDTFDLQDDFAVGAALRPLAIEAAIPLDFIARGLEARVSAGFLRAEVQGYELATLSGGAFVGWTVGGTRHQGRPLEWRGVTVELGAALGRNRLSTVVAPGIVARTLSFDPDGAGPLPVFDLDIQVDPRIELDVVSSSLVFPFSVSTGIELLDTIALVAGGGADLSAGSTSIGVQGAPVIAIQGFLADLVEESGQGRVEVSGSVDQGYAASLRPFAFAGAAFRVGPFELSAVALYRSPGGLAAGVSMGVSLR